jgi:hypothetical protein
MKDPMDMTDEEYRLYHARDWAARVYRAEGFTSFADRVERGEVDGCSQVRLARFFVEPPQPHNEEFIAAWREFAAPADAHPRT